MLSDLRYRLRALFRRGAMERDLATELELHYEREAAKLMSRGLSPVEAQRRARLAIGGIEQVKEETRDAWGVRLLESIVQDAPKFLEAHVSLATVYYRLQRREDGARERAIVEELNKEIQARQLKVPSTPQK